MNWLDHKPDKFEYNGKWIKNWFSNMVLCPTNIDGLDWPSTENYYQAMKTLDPELREQIRNASPSQSKKLGRKLKLRPDWEEVKIDVMSNAVYSKFTSHEDLMYRLLNEDAPIIEWNNWGDQTWGVTLDGKGLNLLGVILTALRTTLIMRKLEMKIT